MHRQYLDKQFGIQLSLHFPHFYRPLFIVLKDMTYSSSSIVACNFLGELISFNVQVAPKYVTCYQGEHKCNTPLQNTCLSATLPCALVSSQPTSCFAHELPFSVANAGRPTSFSIEALYTSIGELPVKKFH